MTLVFVYGTLKRGGGNHRHLAGQQFLGKAGTVPGYALYALGDYPGMVRAPEESRGIQGEVWQVDAACLAQLDRLEGVSEGLYERVSVKLAAPFHDQPVETYLYLPSPGGRRVAGTEWPE